MTGRRPRRRGRAGAGQVAGPSVPSSTPPRAGAGDISGATHDASAGVPTPDGAVPPLIEWDDVLWDDVWERVLGPVERHTIGLDVCRARLSDDRFEAQVGIELARRWRRRARNLATVYSCWVVFWSLIAWNDLQLRGSFTSYLSPVNAAVGLVAVSLCLLARRRLARYARQGTAQLEAVASP